MNDRRRMEDKVCVVTGSTGGIGEAIAVLLAEHGGKVVVSGRNQTNGTKIVETITAAGNTASFIRCDVGKDDECETLIQQTIEQFGVLHCLVNNAAATDVPKGDRSVTGVSPESWDLQFRVNLRAVFYLSRLAIPHMRQAGSGTIVNISSVGGMVAFRSHAAYVTAKGGINQLTRSMALDYAGDNIRVNALCPGWILTPVEEARIKNDPAVVERQIEQMGLQRMGTPREMAYAALFLACEESSYVTGTALVADGGWTLQ